MNNKHSNLIWVVLCSVIVLNAVVICCDTVYAGQIAKYADMTLPEIFVVSAKDNIYPWSKTEEPKTNTIAKTEVETKVAKPIEVETKAIKVAETEIGPGVESSTNETQVSAENTTPQFVTSGIEYFNDACFIGDSFTEGLTIYSQIPNADFYGLRGVSTSNVMKKSCKLPNGGSGTLEQALAQKQYGKIYIELGINEIGNNDPAGYTARYLDIINRIKALQPNAIIYIQSVLHTTQNKSNSSSFKNEYVNAYNQAAQGIADNKTIFYIDLNPLFDDETGALRADYSGDGVHIKAPHYITWRDYLLTKTIVPKTEPETGAI